MPVTTYAGRVWARAWKDAARYVRENIPLEIVTAAAGAVVVALITLWGKPLTFAALLDQGGVLFLGAVATVAVVACLVLLWNLILAPSRLDSELRATTDELSTQLGELTTPKLLLRTGSGPSYRYQLRVPAREPEHCDAELVRVSVHNKSACVIHNVCVRLEHVDPCPLQVQLPLPLQRMHDNPPSGRFDMSPGDVVFIDVVYLMGTKARDPWFEIAHTVPGVPEVGVLRGGGRFCRVVATGDETSPASLCLAVQAGKKRGESGWRIAVVVFDEEEYEELTGPRVGSRP